MSVYGDKPWRDGLRRALDDLQHNPRRPPGRDEECRTHQDVSSWLGRNKSQLSNTLSGASKALKPMDVVKVCAFVRVPLPLNLADEEHELVWNYWRIKLVNQTEADDERLRLRRLGDEREEQSRPPPKTIRGSKKSA